MGDLIIGALGAHVKRKRSGAVFVLYGSPSGPTTAGATRVTEANVGAPGGVGKDDEFGFALAIANFDASGRNDLAVSAADKPSQPGAADAAGWVFVVPGGANGLVPSGSTALAGFDISGQTTSVLFTGAALSAGNFGRGSAPDLAVGIPGLTAQGNQDAGGAAILFGGTGGLSTQKEQLVDGDTITGFPADSESDYGRALIASPKPFD